MCLCMVYNATNGGVWYCMTSVKFPAVGRDEGKRPYKNNFFHAYS